MKFGLGINPMNGGENDENFHRIHLRDCGGRSLRVTRVTSAAAPKSFY